MGTECHYFMCDVANREEVYKQAKVVREKVKMDSKSVKEKKNPSSHLLLKIPEAGENNVLSIYVYMLC